MASDIHGQGGWRGIVTTGRGGLCLAAVGVIDLPVGRNNAKKLSRQRHLPEKTPPRHTALPTDTNNLTLAFKTTLQYAQPCCRRRRDLAEKFKLQK